MRLYSGMIAVQSMFGMAYDSAAVANYFLKLAKGQGKKVTPMQMQKLVYFAHGWCLALTDRALINETVEAWDYGPVIRSLYHSLKEYGNGPITEPIKDVWIERPYEIPVNSYTERSRKLIERMWEVYGRFDAIALSEITHQMGTPWYQVVEPYNFAPPKGLDIPDKIIGAYFREQLGRTS